MEDEIADLLSNRVRTLDEVEDGEIVQFTMKMTRGAREELRAVARERGLTTVAYLHAAVKVERWNHRHRHHRTVLEDADGRFEVLLPSAGVAITARRADRSIR